MSAASEGATPIGLTPAAEGGELIGQESPEVMGRALAVTARLLAGASTFFFLAFLFAYFYLRSINQDNMWRPHHIKPSAGLGVAFIACIILSAGLVLLANRGMKSGSKGWTTPALIGVLLGLAAIVIQCIEYTVQDFGPTDGAFASVFCAWTAFFMLVAIGALYWLETQVATELRARREPAGSRGEDIAGGPDLLIEPGLDAAAFYWAFLAGIGVITYVTLYLL